MADPCEHWTSETGYAQASLYAACPWCELKRLKQELSLAEEGLANYAQEVKELRNALDRVRDADSVEETFRIAVEALGSSGHPKGNPP